jgi:hypothetical protein
MGTEVGVVYDPDPDGAPSPWRTYKRCLEAAVGKQTPTLILQDDATPHPLLLDITKRIVRRHPDRLVCLYHGRHPAAQAPRLMMARDRGLCYAEMRTLRIVPCVALIWPWLLARAALAREELVGTVAADDEMIARVMHRPSRRNLASIPAMQDTYLVATPSIVEHHDEEPSIMSTYRREPRRALWFAGDDAAELNWESDVLAFL